MKLEDVIAQVRAQCPSFEVVTHVFTPPETLMLPAALVGPVQFKAEGTTLIDESPPTQPVVRMFGVHIVMDRKVDPPTGPTAAHTFSALHEEVVAALQGFTTADDMWGQLEYAGGAMRTLQENFPAVWRDDFVTTAEAYTAT